MIITIVFFKIFEIGILMFESTAALSSYFLKKGNALGGNKWENTAVQL